MKLLLARALLAELLPLLVLLAAGQAQPRDRDPVHSLPLGSEGSLHWRVDFASEQIAAEVHFAAEEFAWFAVGFSDYGEHKPADYCVLWVDWHRETHLQDAWSDAEGQLHLDERQDCAGFEWKRRGNVTKFAFGRKFDTCDEHDYVIERGTTHVVWLKGGGPLSSLAGLRLADARASGMSRTEMLRVHHPKPPMPPDAWQHEVRADRVQVPNVETTYWCKVHKLPSALKTNVYMVFLARDNDRHHVLQFGPAIQQGNEHLVHHMEVFHCAGPAELEVPMYDGPCDSPERPQRTQICKKVLAAWAMGADAFVYPEEAGLPIGGEQFNRHVMLEVHYNNPELQAGRADSSGVRFVFSRSLRRFDAGVLELGLEYTDKMAVPPGQEEFALSGHCVAECTGVGLPQAGIRVFASQLHTHLTGRAVLTRHVRDARELPPLNVDRHYSTHFQEIRLLPRPVRVLPGDSLITTCTYRTLDRANVTLGGFAISDEMCVNYIHYYPNSKLEVCKSAISDDALRTYFRYMREWEGQATSSEKGISDNYRSLHWTRVRVAALHDLYEVAPLGMQCNGSDGSRLPGLWDNIAATPVQLPLAPPARQCPESLYTGDE